MVGSRESLGKLEQHFGRVESVNRVADSNQIEIVRIRNRRKRVSNSIDHAFIAKFGCEKRGHRLGVPSAAKVIKADAHR